MRARALGGRWVRLGRHPHRGDLAGWGQLGEGARGVGVDRGSVIQRPADEIGDLARDAGDGAEGLIEGLLGGGEATVGTVQCLADGTSLPVPGVLAQHPVEVSSGRLRRLAVPDAAVEIFADVETDKDHDRPAVVVARVADDTLKHAPKAVQPQFTRFPAGAWELGRLLAVASRPVVTPSGLGVPHASLLRMG
jgi:hypothetical protein